MPSRGAARALLFQLTFWAWTVILALLVLPAAPFLRERGMRAVARFWMRGIHAALRGIIGLRYEVRGLERVPSEPAIIASKHHSAWETLTFHLLVPDLSVALKHELTRIPIFGWYLMKSGCVRIDRGGAARALRSLLDGAGAKMATGHSFLIYPEGTRHAVGAAPDYKPGVAALYAALRRPVVPVALTSGLFWGRRLTEKRAGTITIEFLEPLPPDLPRREFMERLQERIEGSTRRLVEEARSTPLPAPAPSGHDPTALLYAKHRPGSSVGRAAD